MEKVDGARRLICFPRSGRVPNSPLAAIVYWRALAPGADARAYEEIFARNGWSSAWRNGVYPFHHYHSTTHEVLGIVAGWAKLRLGGQAGEDLLVSPGCVVILPAGTGHKRVEASHDFLVVGAYPDGRHWDLLKADDLSEEDVRRAEARIASLPVPDLDPATGEPLASVWSGIG